MRYLFLLFCLLLMPAIAGAATMAPRGDFTLNVSVSADDLTHLLSEDRDFFTHQAIESHSRLESNFTSYSFDTRGGWYTSYAIIGSVLKVEARNSVFTYDFATRSGSHRVNEVWGLVRFSFTAGGPARYYYQDDDDPTYLYEEAEWSDTRVALKLAPVPLPAALPLLAAGLGALALLGRRRRAG